MGLINLKTNLKSLKYTNDRPAGGNSGQPFIQNPIIEEPGKLAQVDTDTILRGGLRAPLRAIEDVARMTKYLFNPKSPNGFLFIAKQNILSRTSVATEASITTSYGNSFNKPVSQFPGIDDDIPKDLSWTRASLNQGIYTPLSTLTQVGIGFLGNHLNTFGILPTDPTDILGFLPKLSIVRYEDVIRNQTGLEKREKKVKYPKKIARPSFEVAPRRDFSASSSERKIISNAYENRLVYLTFTHQYNSPGGTTLFNYNGGPGSILGIGKTTISFTDKKTPGLTRTGENNILAKTEPAWFWKGGIKLHDNSNNYDEAEREFLIPTSSFISHSLSKEVQILPSDISYAPILDPNYNYISGSNRPPKTDKFKFPIGASDKYNKQNGSILGPNFEPDGVTPLEKINNPLERIEGVKFLFLNLDPGYLTSQKAKKGKPQNINFKDKKTANRLSSPRSEDEDLLNRLTRGRTINFESRVGTGDPGQTKGNISNKLDNISSGFIYKSRIARGDEYNDFVQFRVGAINPNNPSGSFSYAHFRAFIEDFSDSYKSSWKGTNYMGRGEKFYKYQNFDRDISIGFKVAAQSGGEMAPIYQKLNWFASLTAPSYTEEGYMAGNLVKLTVGGYLYEQPGFIESVSYKINKDYPWNIAVGDQGNIPELPMVIDVDLKFTPIHAFRPEIFKWDGKDEDKTQQYISAAFPEKLKTLYGINTPITNK